MGNKIVTTETVVPMIDKKGRIIRYKNGSKNMCKVKEEKQITVIWHVDDLMMSCKENFELTKFSCSLYLRLKKALYGILRSSPLLYRKLLGEFEVVLAGHH